VTSGNEEVTSREIGLCESLGDFREELSLKEALAEHERTILLQALRQYGTTRRVARALGISQASAARKLKELREESGKV
jgi:TyrR family helix-turn-helix protein